MDLIKCRSFLLYRRIDENDDHSPYELVDYYPVHSHPAYSYVLGVENTPDVEKNLLDS